MNGKGKCKILKQIRQQIAAENDIEFVTSECKFQGECSGTCPKCESELHYLEQELQKRRQAGKAVAVAGIAAAMIVSAAGCSEFRTGGVPESPPTQSQEDLVEGQLSLPGVPVLEPTDPDDFTEPFMGEPLPNYSTEDKN